MLDRSHISAIKPSDLPVPPQAAIQIMHACSREDVNNKEISHLAATDPVITAELLRIVNSSFFALPKQVQSVPHAITILGHRTLRNVVLCMVVRDALREDSLKGFDTTSYWEAALRRAVSARLLGQSLGLDADECFTAGLLQDFGLLVMFSLNPEKAAFWPQFRVENPDVRYTTEHQVFNTTHDQVILMLAEKWKLPSTLSQALGLHHKCDQESNEVSATLLCKILHCTDWTAALYAANDKAAILKDCRRILNEVLDLNANQVEDLLSAVPEQVEQAAQALGLRIEKQPDFNHIMREANVLLVEENLSYQELTWRLEKTLKERDQLAEELNREMEMAQEIQKSLLPRQVPADFPVTGINVAARELSGDFYDYFTLSDGRIYFNLGDVSGKGITAALLMAKTSSLFRCLGKQLHDPGKLLSQINTEICETSIRGMFVTMIAGLYDPSNGNIRLVNAGHPPAILLSQEHRLRAVNAQAPPLGIVPDSDFPEVELSLSGGSLYLFSDGITEGHIDFNEQLGMLGFLEMILDLENKSPIDRLEAIVAKIKDSAAPLRDDMTILLVEDHRDAR